jgi:hypothetical protein
MTKLQDVHQAFNKAVARLEAHKRQAMDGLHQRLGLMPPPDGPTAGGAGAESHGGGREHGRGGEDGSGGRPPLPPVAVQRAVGGPTKGSMPGAVRAQPMQDWSD